MIEDGDIIIFASNVQNRVVVSIFCSIDDR
jgi:hypothetical protein